MKVEENKPELVLKTTLLEDGEYDGEWVFFLDRNGNVCRTTIDRIKPKSLHTQAQVLIWDAVKRDERYLYFVWTDGNVYRVKKDGKKHIDIENVGSEIRKQAAIDKLLEDYHKEQKQNIGEIEMKENKEMTYSHTLKGRVS